MEAHVLVIFLKWKKAVFMIKINVKFKLKSESKIRLLLWANVTNVLINISCLILGPIKRTHIILLSLLSFKRFVVIYLLLSVKYSVREFVIYLR